MFNIIINKIFKIMNNNRRRNFRGRQQKSNFLEEEMVQYSITSTFNNGNIKF